MRRREKAISFGDPQSPLSLRLPGGVCGSDWLVSKFAEVIGAVHRDYIWPQTDGQQKLSIHGFFSPRFAEW
jgi:hypothetical protein